MPAVNTYYDVAMRRFDEQIDRIGALDAKAATTLGAAAALLPIFGAVLAAFNTHPPRSAVVLYGIAFVIYIGMVCAAIRASRVARWDLRPDLSVLEGYARSKNDPTVKMWAANECKRAIETNGPGLHTKAVYTDLSLAALLTVALLLSAASLLDLVA